MRNAPELGIATRFQEAFGKPGNDVLIAEIGTGAGSDLHLLKKAGYNVHGIEPVKKLRELAVEAYPELAGCISHGSLPHSLPAHLKGKCDGVFSTATLQHIPREQLPEAIESIKALLKAPGGKLLIGMPFARADYDKKTGRDSTGRLQNEYTPEELTRHFENAGFRLKRFYGNNTDPSQRKLEWHNYIFELVEK